MPLFRSLQHWLTGRGPCLQGADFVPATPPLRPWAQTLPWAAVVAAIARAFAQRFPNLTTRGRPPVSTRGFLALELLQPAWGGADEQIGRRVRTDLAVLSAGGLREVPVEGAPTPGVLPDVRAPWRSRRDAPRREARLAVQAATAREEGVVSPAHLVVAPVPREQGRPRVTAAAPLEKAPQPSSR